MAITD